MIALNSKRQHPIGLHLGPRRVRLVQLQARADAPRIHAMAEAELPPLDEAAPEARDREIAAIIRRLVSDHGFRGRLAVSCVGAQDLFVQNVRLPQMAEAEVTAALSWEAQERLPYPVADAELRHIHAGTLRLDGAAKQEVILLACHRGVVEHHIQLLELAGLTPSSVDLEACAILRSLLPGLGAGEAAGRRAYLNFGDAATTVVFADGDQMLFLKSISGGGRDLDQVVARHLDLDVNEARRMRAAVVASPALDPANDVHRSVIDAIRGSLESISADIELCLRYYKVTFRGRPLDAMTLTGSEASPWLAEFLSERLGVPCDIGNPFRSLEGTPHGPLAERPFEWTTAIGLARR